MILHITLSREVHF